MNVAVAVASIAVVGTIAGPSATSGPRRPWTTHGRGRMIRMLDQGAVRLTAVLPFDLMISSRSLGITATVIVALVAVSPVLAAMPLLGLVVTAARRRRRQRALAVSLISRGLPDVIDLLTMAVGAGLTPRLALATTSVWLPGPYREAADEVERRSESGEPFVVALDIAFVSLGPEVRPLTATLIAANTDGAALLPALERVGDEARRRRRVEAEDRARRVPVAMLFPLIVCVLPAFALLTVVPLLVGTLSELQIPG